MTPVFANSAWVEARERFVLRKGSWQKRALRVRYGLFVHPSTGPVLIDTGYTARCLTGPDRSVALRAYGRMLAPRLIDAGQPEPFLGRFGLHPRDIKTVLVTHLHADHISGLCDFQNATFLCSNVAIASLQQRGKLQNLRHGIFPELLPGDFETRMRAVEDSPIQSVSHLPAGHDVFGDGSVLTIPLPGHAPGHLAVLFPKREAPLLYATDTQWISDALRPEARPRLAPRLFAEDFDKACRSSDQVERFQDSGGAVVLCHDDSPSGFDFDQGTRP
ncbi:MBL fold metallo-hydrolase [Palleronia caenipelagi]|uniref:MBL fold metallo-hydrolase n=1 Tax=Palleronia caenipelagi TaxID=2489174 RepID=A0A547PNQ9_9RHOB|nr:MBL fold metallo-hydrolase [Palleronia caenipelagi]TRD15793.1 MBL fold metallo-hydrolase [Palleronia caenipelagi]